MQPNTNHVFVATPIGKNGLLHIGTASFCASVVCRPDVTWGFTMTHTAEMSRNVLIERRLKEDDGVTSHILFLDSDVIPPPDALDRMLAHNEDIVTCATPIFFEDSLMWNVGDPTEGVDRWFYLTDTLPDKPFYTKKCGGGAMLVKRRVFESIGWPFYKTEYKPLENDNKVIKTGEDIWFCNRAVECGYKILCDPSLMCHHYNMVDLLSIYNTVVCQIEKKINNSKAE